MAYFTEDYCQFLIDLAGNNNRDWFQANKKRYEKSVKNPFKVFVEAAIAELSKINPSLDILAKDAIFRIYRDVRFAKDKTPYKLNSSAIISPGGKKDKTYPGVYIEFSPEDLRFYSGLYMLDKHQLQRVRTAIMTHGEEFEKLINNKKFKALFGEIQGEKNKRIPKEFKEAAVKQPLIANKQFYFFTKMDTELLESDDLMSTIIEYYKVAKPLSDFLEKAVLGK